jgi:DNA mismatch endonuclease, patch repair protein
VCYLQRGLCHKPQRAIDLWHSRYRMADTVAPAVRSRIMLAVKSRNGAAEMTVRRRLHSLGYRFRIHDHALPGAPDIVFSKRKLVIFVNGCFWHGHVDCRRSDRPASRLDYWNRKLDRNIERDRLNQSLLAALGWRVLVVWECSLPSTHWVEDLVALLGPAARS